MKEETIKTRHPEGKKGVNISKGKYDAIREALISKLRGKGKVPLQEVRQAVERELKGNFEGSIPWYFENIKLDLEARNVIQKVAGKKLQHLRLVESQRKSQD